MDKHEKEITECLSSHGYKIKDPIGNGGFATVYTCLQEKFNTLYCVKLMELTAERKSLPESFNAEINSLIKVIHPNVVAIYDFFQSEHMLYIILEYCTGGSLDKLIQEDTVIEPPRLYSMCKQIINALMVVHSLGIAHRDIKPQNILLDNHKRPKLADFGLSQQIFGSELSERFSGSLPFKSPEILQMKPYDPFLADVWALGVTFYMMAFGTLPWKANTLIEWKSLVCSGCVDFPRTADVKFVRALRQMIEPNAKVRATLQEVANMPIFADAETSYVNSTSKQFLNSPQMNFTLNFDQKKTMPVAFPKQGRQSSNSMSQIPNYPSTVPKSSVVGTNSCVFSWKRRCSKVTRMVHFTFEEKDDMQNC